MKSGIGSAIKLTVFGESHSAAIGGVIDGLNAGIKLNLQGINNMLGKRRAKGSISTKRVEPDTVRFISGYYNGFTTGTPLCYIIENTNVKSGDYTDLNVTPRPSHADYAAHVKYNGYEDYRGGGHFSGRLTAPIVVAGAICSDILDQHNIKIGTRISSLFGEECSEAFAEDAAKLADQINILNSRDFPTFTDETEQKMRGVIENAAHEGDSVGGILETCILGIEPGIGEPMFYSVESVLSHLFYSIPAVKGVEFGLGFDITKFAGSRANDRFIMADGAVKTVTNNNGGINGGVTNGMPIIARIAVKPTPSIYKPQQTVNLNTNENTELQIKGRHDPAIIHRAAVVATAAAAFGILDLMTERYGYLWQTNGGGI